MWTELIILPAMCVSLAGALDGYDCGTNSFHQQTAATPYAIPTYLISLSLSLSLSVYISLSFFAKVWCYPNSTVLLIKSLTVNDVQRPAQWPL